MLRWGRAASPEWDSGAFPDELGVYALFGIGFQMKLNNCSFGWVVLGFFFEMCMVIGPWFSNSGQEEKRQIWNRINSQPSETWSKHKRLKWTLIIIGQYKTYTNFQSKPFFKHWVDGYHTNDKRNEIPPFSVDLLKFTSDWARLRRFLQTFNLWHVVAVRLWVSYSEWTCGPHESLQWNGMRCAPLSSSLESVDCHCLLSIGQGSLLQLSGSNSLFLFVILPVSVLSDLPWKPFSFQKTCP